MSKIYLWFVLVLSLLASLSIKAFDWQEEGSHFTKIAIGAGAGMAVDRTLFYPVDFTVTQKQFQRRSADSIIRNAVAKEGLLGLFRGYKVQLLSAVPISGVFALNDIMYQRTSGSSLHKEAFAGVTSALLFSIVYNPFDIRRTWQVTHRTDYRPSGWMGNFRGITLQFGRSFIYSLGISGTRALSQGYMPDNASPTVKYIMGGFLPGCFAQVFMSPVDLIKTRVMADPKERGILFHLRNVIKEKAICDGMLLRVVRHGPATGLIMGVMKWVESIIDN